ncbi:MAG: 50S ribosomal protein L1 [Opitutales bacterium]|jgi:large subunit ribosomal protein L1|tara:strand:+ start:957 stop:1649 length:693 start_codon:yes stop_codon:yes gene_type:complete
MISRSKKYRKSMEGFSSEETKTLPEAFVKLTQFEKVKFDETVEVSCSLGVDPKQSSQGVRGTVNLPHGSGKEVRVIVFTENTDEAIKAGADHAGLEDLIAKVKDGWTDFDVALATTDSMKSVRSIARVLGPRGLMPTPKAGTVTDNITEAITAVKAGRVEFKMDKTGVLAVVVGKRSFSNLQLEENATTALAAIVSSRPDGFKGKFIKSVYISSTMSPSVKVNTSTLELN